MMHVPPNAADVTEPPTLARRALVLDTPRLQKAPRGDA
jgi:hypothetical protein